MAFNFFSDNRILNIDVNSIPVEFTNYFDGVDENRKKAIASIRPDLAEAIGYNSIENKNDALYASNNQSNTINVKINSNEYDEIKKNIYEGKELKKLLSSNIGELDAFIIPNSVKKCYLHNCHLEEENIKLRNKGHVFGAYVYHCKECNRLFVKENIVSDLEKKLVEFKIPYKLFDASLSRKYLRSQIEVNDFKNDEKIFIIEPWVEEDPKCPFHKTSLFCIPCRKRYKDRAVNFFAYACEDCSKKFIRASKTGEINDLCAENGVPSIEFEIAREDIKPKKTFRKTDKIDFYVDNGRIKEFSNKIIDNKYMIDESDTVVISDSTGCNIFDHETEDVPICIKVIQKRNGQKNYLFKAGYCKVCQKFFLEEDDYKAIYSKGRPCANIMVDVNEDNYYITSGEVFDIENKHLEDVEKELDKEIINIKNNSDYVDPYEKAIDYEDYDRLIAAKAKSLRIYEPQIEDINDSKKVPYVYRVDLVFANNVKTFYVGAKDVELPQGYEVISFNYPFGKKIVNTRNTHAEYDGAIYEIRLIRQFDISNEKLFGYSNIRTEEDLIFKNGVTDPFLVRVLKTRKKQHSLIDIIATIQENQDKIVEADYKKNIIVQGCAGSGKTMVLLHRLSYLKYNNDKVFKDNKTVIITPNEQFNLHIKGLASGLQLDKIERLTIEKYYVGLLNKYGFDNKIYNDLSSELSVNQELVDYIYSDDFLKCFNKAFEDYINERNKVIPLINSLADEMGEARPTIDLLKHDTFIPTLKRRNEYFLSCVREKKENVIKLENDKKTFETRNNQLRKDIPESKEKSETIVQEVLKDVNFKLADYVNSLNTKITIYKEELAKKEKDIVDAESTILPFVRRARIDKLTKEKDALERNISFEEERLKDAFSVVDNKMHTKSDEEILDWMIKVSLIIPEVKADRNKCLSVKRKYADLLLNISETEGLIEKTLKELEEAREKIYSPEVERTIAYIDSKCENDLDVHILFRRIFYNSIRSFLEEKNIKIKSGTRRFDLYAEILFAQKFYGKNVGEESFICVDEGQSLAFNEFKLLNEINNGVAIFNIYGDTNQLLKLGRGISNWSSLEEYFDSQYYTLNENYRNTNQITRFCNESFGMNVLQTGVDGLKVKEIAREELESELSMLNIGESRIAVLIPKCVKKQDYLDFDLIDKSVRKAIKYEIGNGIVSYMYVDEVRGIEFDKVFVVANKMAKNEKYIAYTRALSELIIVVDEQLQDAIIEDVQDDNQEIHDDAISTNNTDIQDKEVILDNIDNQNNKDVLSDVYYQDNANASNDMDYQDLGLGLHIEEEKFDFSSHQIGGGEGLYNYLEKSGITGLSSNALETSQNYIIVAPGNISFNWKVKNGQVRVNCKLDEMQWIESQTGLKHIDNGPKDSRPYSFLLDNFIQLESVVKAIKEHIY